MSDTSAGSSNWTYGYDALDRMTSAVSSAVARGWSYDANGNRLSETGSAASTYSIASTGNQITGITGSLARTYNYDAAGNTLSYSTVTATYNDRGRLQTLTNGSTTASYLYNALGQLIRSSGTSGIEEYAYDEAGHLVGEYDGAGNLIEETVWLGDTPVATLQPNGSTVTIYYVHTDHLNTPRQVTRPSDNAQIWTWFSDPFGTDAANGNPAGAGPVTYRPRFPGQIFLSPAGLHQNYLRDYDSATGRYVESDPIGLRGGSNTYVYALSKPIRRIDPTGLVTVVVINNNTPIIGTHAGLYTSHSTDGGAMIYDPSGSYQNTTRGEDGVFSPLPKGGLLDYLKFEMGDGIDVQSLIFNTSPDEEKEISKRAEDYGDPRGLKCADSVARVLAGVGPFKDLGKLLNLEDRTLAVTPRQLLNALLTLQGGAR